MKLIVGLIVIVLVVTLVNGVTDKSVSSRKRDKKNENRKHVSATTENKPPSKHEPSMTKSKPSDEHEPAKTVSKQSDEHKPATTESKQSDEHEPAATTKSKPSSEHEPAKSKSTSSKLPYSWECEILEAADETEVFFKSYIKARAESVLNIVNLIKSIVNNRKYLFDTLVYKQLKTDLKQTVKKINNTIECIDKFRKSVQETILLTETKPVFMVTPEKVTEIKNLINRLKKRRREWFEEFDKKAEDIQNLTYELQDIHDCFNKNNVSPDEITRCIYSFTNCDTVTRVNCFVKEADMALNIAVKFDGLFV